VKKTGIIAFAVCFFIFTSFQPSKAKRKNYYRTFEIIAISGNGLTLQDGDGNVIEVDRDPEGYKVGYKVRYDSVRKRLRTYRWQDYDVVAIANDSITLQHKSGDILSVTGNYMQEFEIGDPVRYDSIDNKLQADEDGGQWLQYTVVASYSDKIILQSNTGREIVLHLDNNIYKAPRGLFIAKYKVGDLVRYNVAGNKLKKAVLRTYDWQEYEVRRVTADRLILHDKNGEELVLENTYGMQFENGDRVKYDRLNNIIKKVR